MIIKLLRQNILYLALIQVITAVLGSLYFSEIRHFPPCVLCWYQRILLYPLVIIISVGILRKDKGLYNYVLPMSIFGTLIAIYQVMLQIGILPESISPCTIGVSCITKFVSYFGFITIPVMSLAAFIVISICMLIFKNNQKQ